MYIVYTQARAHTHTYIYIYAHIYIVFEIQCLSGKIASLSSFMCFQLDYQSLCPAASGRSGTDWVLVSHCCYNKLPQTQRLKQYNCFLQQRLEVRNTKIKVPQGCISSEDCRGESTPLLFLASRSYLNLKLYLHLQSQKPASSNLALSLTLASIVIIAFSLTKKLVAILDLSK